VISQPAPGSVASAWSITAGLSDLRRPVAPGVIHLSKIAR
jgi:hypothetical protein